MANDKPLPMTRRDAGLTFGTLVTALMIPACASAPDAAALAWAPKALSPGQALVLDAVAEVIIPPSDTPGAREAGVPQFVDRAVLNFCTPENAQAIRAGLDRIDADARAGYGAVFAVLKSEQQVALLTRYEAEARQPRVPPPMAPGDTETGLSARTLAAATAPALPHFFSTLKELVTVGYFTSQLGATKAVRYDPVPGAYRGCVPLQEIGRAWAT
jgi:gluconate 2-dehydrogenase gamma chain